MQNSPEASYHTAEASWPPPIIAGDARPLRGVFLPQQASAIRTKVAAGVYALFLLIDLVRGFFANFIPPAFATGYAIVDFVVFLVLGVFFLIWVHAITKNLAAYRTVGQSASPGWAVGCYLIPIVSLYRPLRNMQDVWKASDPQVDSSNHSAWNKTKAAALIGGWWALYLTWGFSSYAVLGATTSAAKYGQTGSPQIAGTTMVSSLLGMAALFAMVNVVTQINTRQEVKEAAMVAEASSRDTMQV